MGEDTGCKHATRDSSLLINILTTTSQSCPLYIVTHNFNILIIKSKIYFPTEITDGLSGHFNSNKLERNCMTVKSRLSFSDLSFS